MAYVAAVLWLGGGWLEQYSIDQHSRASGNGRVLS